MRSAGERLSSWVPPDGPLGSSATRHGTALAPSRPDGLAVRHDGTMAAHPLTRGEITELAGRLHGLLDMIVVDEMTATPA